VVATFCDGSTLATVQGFCVEQGKG